VHLVLEADDGKDFFKPPWAKLYCGYQFTDLIIGGIAKDESTPGWAGGQAP